MKYIEKYLFAVQNVEKHSKTFNLFITAKKQSVEKCILILITYTFWTWLL